jgi:predicted transcriptional regulator
MSDKTVGDLMHKGIIACRPATPLNEVVRIVSDTDVHAIAVLDDDQHAIGVISHTDIIRFYGEDLAKHKAEEVMSSKIYAIGPDEPAKMAADLMLANGIHRLLVVEGSAKTPVGIISTTDLVKEMRGSRWIWYMG